MQSLTQDVWASNFTQLRPVILEEWPDLPREELETVRGDYQHLVALIVRSTGRSATDVRRQLANIDVDDLGIDVERREAAAPDRGSLDQLQLGTGFTDAERDRVVARLTKLNRRLKRFPADGTYLELSIKDRDTNSQQVTLECEVPGFRRIVAVSKEPNLQDALMDVREDLWRQLDDAVQRRVEGSR